MASYPTKKYRGTALIIGFEKFDTPPGWCNIDRDGCQEDIKIMESMFEKLDFFVLSYKDLKKDRLLEKITQACEDPRNEESECFVLALSGHGAEIKDDTKDKRKWYHCVMAADRQFIYLDELLEKVSGAKYLIGKPKVFIFQACRSKDKPQQIVAPGEPLEDEDLGVLAQLPVQKTSPFGKPPPPEFNQDNFLDDCDNLYDGWQRDPECWRQSLGKSAGTQSSDATGAMGDTYRGPDSGKLPEEPVEILSVKCPEDCLIYYPIMSGKSALRDPIDGSVMMTSMWQLFPFLLKGQSLFKYLTRVNRHISEQVTRFDGRNLKMTPSVLHRLTKSVIFNPKSENSPMAKAKKLIEKD